MAADGDHPADGPAISLRGPRVGLGPLHPGLLPAIARWENDLPLSILSGEPARPLTAEALAADPVWAGRGGPGTASFAIYELAAPRPIGVTGLRHIDAPPGTAEFGISIGEADCRGRGYGTEATGLLLRHAFSDLGLRGIFLEVWSFNPAAIRTYLRVGFREIGRRRQAQVMAGRAYDRVYMECLAGEFRDPLA
ncbi:MAG TPA: GNAT family protein [Thermomicrobiaceae bacterium]|nr:GNAT family protein [Thermomicrobiaceae bacterium]